MPSKGHYWYMETSRRVARLKGGLLTLTLLLAACNASHDFPKSGDIDANRGVRESISSRPLVPRAPRTAGSTLFEGLPPEKTGVDVVQRMVMDHRLSFLNHTPFVCGGVAIGDVNGDGRPDLLFTSGPDDNRLYIQRGAFVFEEIADAGIDGGNAWGVGAALVDIEGDGDLDIYVCNYDSANQLYLNDGSGEHFEESAREYGLDLRDASFMPTFADYDNDGDLDVFVLTNRYYRPGGRPARPPVAMRAGKPYVLPEFEKYYDLRQIGPNNYTADTCGRPDRLYRNDGSRFVDVSLRAGIHTKGHGLSATWWDYDRDGLLDLYVGNDFTDPDRLYKNNGDGTFTDVIADTMPYTTWSSMGADCADIDNDGLLDFMSADMAATTHYKSKVTMGEMGDRRWFLENAWPRQTMRNVVYRNTGVGRFEEVAYLCGLAATDWTWAVKMADFDNDGRVDVFVSNGSTRMSTDADVPVTPQMLVGRTEWDIWQNQSTLREQNLAFRNCGDFRFEDVSRSWGLDHVGLSYGTAFGDLDADGDLDLVVANVDEPVSIYRNREAARRRIVVELVGSRKNRGGLGAVVRMDTSSGTQVRVMNPMTGFLSSNCPVLHFGLGDLDTVDKLTVTWPGGQTQSFEDLAADQRYIITEPRPAASSSGKPVVRDTWFRETASQIGLSFVHKETPYDDYARQPLLPGKHSQLGPGLAWGDADGDGDEDLFVGGAKEQAGRLYENFGNGKFGLSDQSSAVFHAHRMHEDMAPLWADVDADGDLDLVVTSGGVECDAGDKLLADRLYLNDGTARFTPVEEDVFPGGRSSSSVAVAADFDADGDLDLFIGGRVVPGKYPEAPESRLLRNTGGKFEDVTESVAPGLKRLGLVTGALWSDANLDGRVDLLVTLEWGPVKLFVNDRGRFRDATREADLDNRTGWWNSITGTDFDMDGDTDYVVMNVGLNTKYGAPTENKPAVLYYGDMDGSGVKRLVEAKSDARGYVPIRGRSCSSSAIPLIAERFPSYRSFASALLPEIYTPRCLDEALRLGANHFESGVLVNDGAGRFAWQALPRIAQASPGYGVVATDLDGDGTCDVHAVGNLFSREPETGLWRGGIGVTLRASEAGRLEILPPVRTGLVVAGDAKGLTVCDLDDDGWPDLVATQNNDRLLAFRNKGGSNGESLRVELKGPRGNPTAIGSRVTLVRADGNLETSEVYAGSGYLSQSTPRLFFGHGQNPIRTIRVRWPNGHESTHEVSRQRRLVCRQPAS